MRIGCVNVCLPIYYMVLTQIKTKPHNAIGLLILGTFNRT